MNSQSSHVLIADTPELPLQRLLVVSENKRSGLILCKGNYAEFAGPGAAVGTWVEQECNAIVAIGSPEIVEVSSVEGRQKAYSRRIQWIRWLQKIAEQPDPIQRVEKLFSSFEEFFGGQILTSLSNETLALLIGVLPSTVATVRSYQRHLEPFDEVEAVSVYKSLTLPPNTLELLLPQHLHDEAALTAISVDSFRPSTHTSVQPSQQATPRSTQSLSIREV